MQHQYSLDLIQHQANGSVISQRTADGYVNATALCKAAGKQFNDYFRLDSTKAFLAALSAKTGIPVDEGNQSLIESRPGSPANGGGSWIHPKVAIHIGQWLSPEFAVQVSEWVVNWMSGKGSPATPAALPYHIQRHMDNSASVPAGYFSILQEMTLTLIAPLEQAGYSATNKIVPDISQGRMFCKYLRDNHGIDTDSLPQYMHRYPDGRVVPAKLYPESILGDFRKFLREVWFQTRAESYFREKAPDALPYLDRIPALAAPKLPKPLPPPWRKMKAA
jgi:hypothetical protein